VALALALAALAFELDGPASWLHAAPSNTQMNAAALRQRRETRNDTPEA
jgi:hypothetical protein